MQAYAGRRLGIPSGPYELEDRGQAHAQKFGGPVQDGLPHGQADFTVLWLPAEVG